MRPFHSCNVVICNWVGKESEYMKMIKSTLFLVYLVLILICCRNMFLRDIEYLYLYNSLNVVLVVYLFEITTGFIQNVSFYLPKVTIFGAFIAVVLGIVGLVILLPIGYIISYLITVVVFVILSLRLEKLYKLNKNRIY